ncbi:MAG: hypothetical protein B6242_17465 [Anaerolineaceae bacterium 4572_78]|nr:MAG: hypothetical protein B6242_17465 [Anaerolineaceae bacterium 4572_78]
MKNNTLPRKFLSYVFTFLFITLILYVTSGYWHELENIRKINTLSLFTLSVLFFITITVNGFNLKLFIEILGVKLIFREWLGIECVRAFANYLPMSAGIAYSATYLKYKNDLPVSKYISFLAGSTLIMLLTFGCWGIILLVIRYLFLSDFNPILLSTCVSFVLVGVISLWMPLPSIENTNRIIRWIENARSGWQLIRSNRLLLIKVMSLQTLSVLLFSTRLFIIFQSLSYDIDMIAVILIAVMSMLIRLGIKAKSS